MLIQTLTSVISVGDNHAGYLGVRNHTNIKILVNDGAMGVVIGNWRNSTATKKHEALVDIHWARIGRYLSIR